MQKNKTLSNAVGLFGGTFDPIHFGHLRTALELLQTLHLQQIRFIPCSQPVHKAPTCATVAQRLDMLKLAITDEPRFIIDAQEIERNTPSFTVDTLRSLRHALGGQQPLAWIIGSDAYAHFDSWHQWQEITRLAHLIIIPRKGYPLPQHGPLAELLAKYQTANLAMLHEQASGAIIVQAITYLAISSTDIRQQLKQGQNPRYLLPETVYHYIQQHAIYGV